MSTGTTSLRTFRPSRETILYGALLLNTELALVAAYVLLTEAAAAPLRYSLYGLLWVNVGLWVLARTRVAPSPTKAKRKAAAVAALYFVALAVAGGLVTPSLSGLPTSVRIAYLPPGWGPAVIYHGSLVNVILMPSRVVGYVALAYLVYATVLDAAGSAVSGLLGLLSCVSCSWPILASIATSVFGGGSALVAATTGLSYGLSTAVFLVTVALLYWRPLGRFGG